MSTEAFIAKWQGVTASELSTSQSFLIDLCAVLGVDAPHATAEQNYMFERPITFAHGDGSQSAGRIGLCRRGAFVIESKKVRAANAQQRLRRGVVAGSLASTRLCTGLCRRPRDVAVQSYVASRTEPAWGILHPRSLFGAATMQHILMDWLSGLDEKPAVVVIEIDDRRHEVRRVEILANGQMGYANTYQSRAGTELSLLPTPEIDEINAQSPLNARPISAATFEDYWRRAVAQSTGTGA